MIVEHQLLRPEDKQLRFSPKLGYNQCLGFWSHNRFICVWKPNCFIKDHPEKVTSSKVNYLGNVSYRQNWIIPCFCSWLLTAVLAGWLHDHGWLQHSWHDPSLNSWSLVADNCTHLLSQPLTWRLARHWLK